MSHEVRIKGGLGNPPMPYYTNEVESKNDVLKQHVSYKASYLPKFADHMKDLLQEQKNEVQRSIISQGEYRLRPEFKSHVVDQTKWFTLNNEQRQREVDKFMKVQLPLTTTHTPDSSSASSSSNASFLSCPLDQLQLPQHFRRNLWSKAQALSSDPDGMVQCPGDHTSWMVKSESGTRPHFVKVAKGGGYLCDDTCLAYKSSKICSHTVAVAVKTGNSEKQMKWYSTTKKKGPSMTAVAEAGKPATAGKKRKGVSKKSSKHIKSIVSGADDGVWHYPQCLTDDDTLTLDSGDGDLSMAQSPRSPQASASTVLHSYTSGSSLTSNLGSILQESVNVQAAVNASTLQLNYSTVHMGSRPPPPPALASDTSHFTSTTYYTTAITTTTFASAKTTGRRPFLDYYHIW